MSKTVTTFEKWRRDTQLISKAILAARPTIGDQAVSDAYDAFDRLLKSSRPAKMVWGGFLFFGLGYVLEYACENFSRGVRACWNMRIDK